MAVSLTSSRLHSTAEIRNPSISCGSKVFAALNFHGVGKSNLYAEFHNNAYRSIWSRSCRGRLSLTPVTALQVNYKDPKDGNFQLLDLKLALERERVIVITKFIDDDFSNKTLALMLYLDSIETKMLKLMICGPGGDLTPTMALYDTMQSLQSPVATHCFGQVFNMATFIVAAGDKGHRTTTALTEIVINPPAGVGHGQADDVCNEAQELVGIRDYLYKEFAKKTGNSVDKIHEDLRETKILNAEEAIEYGIIDRIVRPPPLKPLEPRKKRSTSGLG